MALRGESEEVRKWTARLEACQRDRQIIEPTWRNCLAQYEEQTDEGISVDTIRVNLAFPTIKVLLRSCASSNPYVYINPTRPEFVASADILEFLINDTWRVQRRKRTLRRIALDALILKVGYGMSHLKKNKISGEWEAYLTRVSPAHLWMENSLSVDDAYYIFRKVVISYSQAKKRWPKAEIPPAAPWEIYGEVERELSGGIINREDGLASSEDDKSKCVVYEVHDQLDGEISVIHPKYDRYLVKPKPSPYPTQSLFSELIFNEKLFSHYGISELEPVSKQQAEIDRLRSMMLVHNKRFNRKYALQKGTADPNAKAALESAEDGAIIELDDIDGLKPIADANLSGDVYTYEALVKQDHREITGINEYMRAGAVPRTKTAYETEQIVKGGQFRATEKSDLTSDFIVDVTYKDIAIMKRFYDTPRIVKLVGQSGYYWQEVRQEDIQGIHTVTMHAGSTMPKDEMSNFQRGLLLYQQFANDPNLDPLILRDIVLRLMNVPFRSKLLRQQPLQQEAMGGQQGNNQGMPRGIGPMTEGLPNASKLSQMLRSPGLARGGM